MKQLGMRLRALREGIGLSQSKFADVIGSTQSSINRYENGQATPTVVPSRFMRKIVCRLRLSEVSRQ